MTIFEKRESEVRSYCRSFPAIFEKAKNEFMYDTDGKEYIDFWAGSGAVNFGHNNSKIMESVIHYLDGENILHALDLNTKAKERFLETFSDMVLKPRNLNYKIMCCGPTGTNAVEAALKLARKNKNRTNIISFSGGYHGMSVGSLSVSSDRKSRQGAHIPLNYVSFAPYCTEFKDYRQSLSYLEWMLSDDHSGIDLPAGIILETIQAEGGVNVADAEWLCGVRDICNRYDILMIIDDIQVGVGRNEGFFSWEKAGVVPDMVILSKSISGIGFPMSLLLMKPEYDIFLPSEHNGTFRGFQLGFVSADATIKYFDSESIQTQVVQKSETIKSFLVNKIAPMDCGIKIRGDGMIWGIDLVEFGNDIALQVMKECYKNGLLIERAGRNDTVLKMLPPLTIKSEALQSGLEILRDGIRKTIR